MAKKISKIQVIDELETSSSNQHNFKSEDNIEVGFKWMLILGRIIGICPISISLKSGGSLRFRWRNLSTFHTLSLAFIVFLVFVPELLSFIQDVGKHETLLDELGAVQSALFNFTLLAVYIYWLHNAPKLIQIVQLWSKTMKELNLVSEDNEFLKFCLFITSFLLGICTAEVVLVHSYQIQTETELFKKDDTLIEKLYKSALGALPIYIPHYSVITSVLLMYGYRVSSFSWAFTDIFLIILCRALSIKFREINKSIRMTLSQLQSELREDNHPSREFYGSSNNNNDNRPYQMYVFEPPDGLKKELIWKEIREKISKLCELAEEVTKFVAPLVLACYQYNIFFVMLNSIRFLYDSKTGSSSYVYVSTLQFVMRVVLVTYYASQVHHSTEDVLKSMERYPDSIFSSTAYRIERMLARHPVGVTIGGTVVITRNMFISILSFLFTAEIVLLQAMSTNPT